MTTGNDFAVVLFESVSHALGAEKIVKGSGIGRFGGKAGIAEFTELRWVTVQTTPRHYPF